MPDTPARLSLEIGNRMNPSPVFLAACLAVNLAFTTPAAADDLQDAQHAVRAGDFPKAATIYRTLAEAGDAKAQYNLGLMYNRGEGVPQDTQQAIRWYRQSAENGFVEAQYALGVIYFKNELVPFDYAESIRWYRMAAAQGHARSQLNLGVAYLRGEAVPQSYDEALKWYRLAAAQQESDAQYGLGLLYFGGDGVAQDLPAAHMWLALSAASAADEPRKQYKRQKMLNFVTSRMTPEQIADARQRQARCVASRYADCR